MRPDIHPPMPDRAPRAHWSMRTCLECTSGRCRECDQISLSPAHSDCPVPHARSQQCQLVRHLSFGRGDIGRTARQQTQVALRHQYSYIRSCLIPVQTVKVPSNRAPFEETYTGELRMALFVRRIAVPACDLLADAGEFARAARWVIRNTVLPDYFGLAREPSRRSDHQDVRCNPG